MEQEGKAMYKVAKAILKNDEDVADAMQETALTCWEKIGTLKKEKYFKTWLIRILINHCNAIYRQRVRTVSGELVCEACVPENGYANLEWQEFLSRLDEKYRTVIVLYNVQGFKTREIAEILQVNENTIRGRLAAARKKLEVQYTDEGRTLQRAKVQEHKTFFIAERRGILWGLQRFFYDGRIQGANGKAAHADGTPLAEGEKADYIMEDGSMEFEIMMMADEEEYFIDKPVRVELKDLGTYQEAGEIVVDAEGNWDFEWVLAGSAEVENLN
ncbi:sigma-70 family RNA polymerase sigma factor [Lachnospiraceae bacterium 45-W7]